MDRISLVMIVKNEEQLIRRCLDSVAGVDEIIVCDTGSEDSTISIAMEYTRDISRFAWCDDFALARNVAKARATGDWILSLDADEYLKTGINSVRKAIEMAANEDAVNVRMISENDGQMMFHFPRLFRNSFHIKWFAPVHNYLNVSSSLMSDVEIVFGYSPAHYLDPDRSLRILELEAVKINAIRERFYLGREYWYRSRYVDAIKILGRYVQESVFDSEKAEAFLLMARCYWNLDYNQYPDKVRNARDATLQALNCNSHFKEAALFMAELLGSGRGNSDWQHNANPWLAMAMASDNSNVLFLRNID